MLNRIVRLRWFTILAVGALFGAIATAVMYRMFGEQMFTMRALFAAVMVAGAVPSIAEWVIEIVLLDWDLENCIGLSLFSAIMGLVGCGACLKILGH